jgi:hypothetical protein
MYGSETWSLLPKEEHKLKVFENRVLRRIFGPKREEVAGGWRRLHNEKLYNLCAAPNISGVIKSRMRWVGETAYRILTGKFEGKRPLGRVRCRQEDIKMDLTEVG